MATSHTRRDHGEDSTTGDNTSASLLLLSGQEVTSWA